MTANPQSLELDSPDSFLWADSIAWDSTNHFKTELVLCILAFGTHTTILGDNSIWVKIFRNSVFQCLCMDGQKQIFGSDDAET